MKFANIITLNNRQYRLELDYYDGPVTPGIKGRDYLVCVACWIEGLGKMDAKVFPLTKETALEYIFSKGDIFVKNFDEKVARIEQETVTQGLITIPVIDKTTVN